MKSQEISKMNLLSARRKELYENNSAYLKFYRLNPVLACSDLLGIQLLDEQKYILQTAWITPYVLLCASRNFGKSFLIAIYVMLRWLLFPNGQIYIMSNVGAQAQETFLKIENITFKIIDSLDPDSLTDIIANETVKSPSSKTGFTHNPASFKVESYNGSFIKTLNGDEDNNRGKRGSLVVFDEAGFC